MPPLPPLQLGWPITTPPLCADTPAQNAQDTGTEAGTDTHAHSYANRDLTSNGEVAPRNRLQHCYCRYGTHLHFIFVKRRLENGWKSAVETLTNVTAVNNDCYLLLPGMFYVRISILVLIALSLKTLCLALFIPQLQEPYAAEPH